LHAQGGEAACFKADPFGLQYVLESVDIFLAVKVADGFFDLISRYGSAAVPMTVHVSTRHNLWYRKHNVNQLNEGWFIVA